MPVNEDPFRAISDPTRRGIRDLLADHGELTFASSRRTSRAVRLCRESDPGPVIRRLAEQLGVHPEALRNWIRQDEADRGERDPKATPAPDRVRRDFTAAAPNRLWVADATRIPCGEGVFCLAAVRDAFSNRIVGWRCSDRCDTALILGALEYGIWIRDVRDGGADPSQR